VIDHTGWIVHDERRMHLPELANECVQCLRAEVDRLIDQNVRLQHRLDQIDQRIIDRHRAVTMILGNMDNRRGEQSPIPPGYSD
jgi:hypothetical protein